MKPASESNNGENSLENRFYLQKLLPNTLVDDGKEILEGLSQPQKSIPPRYFYDDRGSALFEQICELPEYYPTRTEAAILTQYASEIAQITGSCELVELGSGSSSKTRLLLDAYQDLNYTLCYVPVDVSAKILTDSAWQLLQDYPYFEVRALVSTYDLALQFLTTSTPFSSRMIAFLGSTLGNFNPQACDRFFSQVTAALKAGDYLLLGIDLQKPIDTLEAAYNDSQGVTAAFNLNVLQHLNWRFDGNFDLDLFEHRAFYNITEAQIEMHLVAKRSHSVYLQKLHFTVEFEAGETILTEISRKFEIKAMQSYLARQGLKPLQVWTDSQQWFGVILCQNNSKFIIHNS